MAGTPTGPVMVGWLEPRFDQMLNALSDHVTECIAHAADAERRAGEATDSQLRADLFDMARRWRHLAESYQFVDSLDHFIVEQRSHRVGKGESQVTRSA
jgi:hypothetical protein